MTYNETSFSGKAILVVDDERDILDVLADSLEMYGAKTFRAINGNDAFEIIQNNPIHIVLSDVRMPDGDGIELLEKLKNLEEPKPYIILLSGFSDLIFDKAKSLGAFEILEKPFKLTDVMKVISKAFS